MQAKTKRLILSISLIISLFIGACGAIQTASTTGTLGAAETFEGMKMVYQQASGTILMQKGELFLMAWPRGADYALTILSQSKNAPEALNATRSGVISFSEYVKTLEAGGWKYVAPSVLPATITKALTAYSVEMAITALNGLPTVFIMPVMIGTPDFLQPEVVIQ